MNRKTRIQHAAGAWDVTTGALSTPIYHASTYRQADIDHPPEYHYSRSGNPTRSELEKLLASLENGVSGFAFASGMAALTTAITSVVKQGDHIVAARDIYGGTYRLLTDYLSKFGVTHTFVDTTSPDVVSSAITASSRLLLLETPSNPLLKITDIKAMASIAHQAGLISIIDNTFMTPYLQRPLDLGIDMSVHSATKFLGGHSDLIAGAIMTKNKELASLLKTVQNTCGNMLSPNDSWLLIRGIKTLSARMDAQCKSALRLAEWLCRQKWVEQVFYPGLEMHPGRAVLEDQAEGYGAVVSVKTDTAERALGIMRNVKLWNVAVSLGGVESILSYPIKMSHAAIPPEERAALGITDTLLRLSVGLEDVDDLIEDLNKAVQ